MLSSLRCHEISRKKPNKRIQTGLGARSMSAVPLLEFEGRNKLIFLYFVFLANMLGAVITSRSHLPLATTRFLVSKSTVLGFEPSTYSLFILSTRFEILRYSLQSLNENYHDHRMFFLLINYNWSAFVSIRHLQQLINLVAEDV